MTETSSETSNDSTAAPRPDARTSDRGASPFADPAAYAALPRTTGLLLSPDGRRLVATVSAPAGDQSRYVSACWEIDPDGGGEPRRLTRSEKGESAAAFLPDGTLLLSTARPVPGAGDEDVASLWALPPAGEARCVLRRPGSIGAVEVARDAGTVVVAASTMPGGEDAEADRRLRSGRKDAGVAAILHEQAPVRFWDHDLGPAAPSLYVATLAEEDAGTLAADGGGPRADEDGGQRGTDDERRVLVGGTRALTPGAGRALDETTYAVSPDGNAIVTAWRYQARPGLVMSRLVVLDAATGDQRVLVDEGEAASWESPAVSPDGRWVACVRESAPAWDEPPHVSLWLVELATGERRQLLDDASAWVADRPCFTADSAAVLVTADLEGEHPVLRVEVGSGELTRLTGHGAYSQLCPSPDGRSVYALRSAYDAAPAPVQIDAHASMQEPVPLADPAPVGPLPGRLEQVTTTAADGTSLRAWLVLPPGASADAAAPLVLWVHGGPMSSWNAWSWRWCPQVLAANGYAVLLPDPALSTGYGPAMLARGWGQWGGTPYDDVMALTDAALERSDLDSGRTAAMGGSYGGYMANVIATRTDRFRAIVTHASLWALDAFQGTTDSPSWWELSWGDPVERPERYVANSPHLHADRIRTPILVVHGDKDYRVPLGEGLRLWNDLVRRGVEAKFLYFPDENHWVLKPGNARVWYETVLAFLATHVLGEPWQRPSLL